ncbi:hypothetical protein [Streptomyces sp. CAI-85]|uniref:hypothetical protein n=1 Tax=Streptomyces sp. CAI-85 TaxID=1472662 RepID=UPI001587F6E4|nr:hypothetical protein [Streptomyces sp. CAI-85]NUV64317.1 hypothetical protein [Streptomyces sp. CAI-85]
MHQDFQGVGYVEQLAAELVDQAALDDGGLGVQLPLFDLGQVGDRLAHLAGPGPLPVGPADAPAPT